MTQDEYIAGLEALRDRSQWRRTLGAIYSASVGDISLEVVATGLRSSWTLRAHGEVMSHGARSTSVECMEDAIAHGVHYVRHMVDQPPCRP